MVTKTPKRILIAPLDWGLGHTTRCVPIIRQVLSLGHIPVVAGNADQVSFIEETFGDIDIIHLDGYNISYSARNKFAQAGLLSQLPAIFKTIRDEHQWLLKQCSLQQIHGIISDNRYGLFHPHIPSVIMTHQLQVQTGFGNIADRALQKAHYKYLNRFHETWVVDIADAPGLAGRLSHAPSLPLHTKYLGLLSRFNNSDNGMQPGDVDETSLVMLLSGPEPQRSILSGKLWQYAVRCRRPVTFIEGSTSAAPPAFIPPHISYHRRLAGRALAPVLLGAGMIVCRSGYSTIMDLVALGKKAVLIPTPGQTEQEYLANHLHKAGIFYREAQDDLDMDNALGQTRQFPFHPFSTSGGFDTYKATLQNWLAAL